MRWKSFPPFFHQSTVEFDQESASNSFVSNIVEKRLDVESAASL